VPPEPVTGLEYSNLSGRPAGRYLSLARRVMPGIGAVEAQIVPYAQAWTAANRQALESDGPLWVVLGDSMSQSIGASAWNRGWVHQAAARLAEHGLDYRIVNLSISGARVRDVIDRELPAMARLGVDPDLVTVLVGSNDLMRKEFRTVLARDYAELAESLPATSVVAPMPQPVRAAREVNEALIVGAAHRGFLIAEAAGPPTSWRGRLAADHFHPNDLGYQRVAWLFADAVLARDIPGTESRSPLESPP
jgi:lysophospholipase L1-like esterase